MEEGLLPYLALVNLVALFTYLWMDQLYLLFSLSLSDTFQALIQYPDVVTAQAAKMVRFGSFWNS